MIKHLAPTLLCLSLAACSADGGLSEEFETALNDFTTATNNLADALSEPVTITGENGELLDLLEVLNTGQTTTVKSDNKTNLSVSGTNNTINVETDLGVFVVGGTNNLIIFSDNVSVDSCDIAGSDNTVQKPDSVSLTCNVTGVGNSGF